MIIQIFEKIPPGLINVNWSGDFGIDLYDFSEAEGGSMVILATKERELGTAPLQKSKLFPLM